MARGLSDLHTGILGIACAVNIRTQGGGEPRVKLPGFGGPVDYRTALGVCLLYGIAPSLEFATIDPRYVEARRRAGMFFEESRMVERARAALSQAASYLVGRGHLARLDRERAVRLGAGYILAPKGLEVGRRHLRPIPLADETLEFFGITAPIGGCVAGMPTERYIDRIKAALKVASA